MDDDHPPFAASSTEDAHGRAALTLVESLMHELAARSVLTPSQVLTVLEVAYDAQSAVLDETPESVTARNAAAILQTLVNSFQSELSRG